MQDIVTSFSYTSTQTPRAIRSLKCIELGIAADPKLGSFCTNGVLKKSAMDKLAFERFCYKHTQKLEEWFGMQLDLTFHW